MRSTCWRACNCGRCRPANSSSHSWQSCIGQQQCVLLRAKSKSKRMYSSSDWQQQRDLATAANMEFGGSGSSSMLHKAAQNQHLNDAGSGKHALW